MITWYIVPEIWWMTDGWTDRQKKWHTQEGATCKITKSWHFYSCPQGKILPRFLSSPSKQRQITHSPPANIFFDNMLKTAESTGGGYSPSTKNLMFLILTHSTSFPFFPAHCQVAKTLFWSHTWRHVVVSCHFYYGFIDGFISLFLTKNHLFRC